MKKRQITPLKLWTDSYRGLGFDDILAKLDAAIEDFEAGRLEKSLEEALGSVDQALHFLMVLKGISVPQEADTKTILKKLRHYINLDSEEWAQWTQNVRSIQEVSRRRRFSSIQTNELSEGFVKWQLYTIASTLCLIFELTQNDQLWSAKYQFLNPARRS